jgi:hypothetical protein
VPADAKVALLAAVIALIPAWFATRSFDPAQPGWAVRVYLTLFSQVGLQSSAAASPARYPVREAFLAAWFLSFFVLFGIGLFVWPEAARP